MEINVEIRNGVPVHAFGVQKRISELHRCRSCEQRSLLGDGLIDAELMPIRYGALLGSNALLGSKLSRQIYDQHRSAQGARFLCRSPATLPEFRHALRLERSNNHQTNFFKCHATNIRVGA
jgi:hypothetical protein